IKGEPLSENVYRGIFRWISDVDYSFGSGIGVRLRCRIRTVLICVVNDIEFLLKILLVDSVLLYEVCNDTVREQKTQRRRKNGTTYAVSPCGAG
ncbi:hypothetical protein ALC62_10023, partial [Cyphomyrmex costatus]